MNNMNSRPGNHLKPQEAFLRQVLFLKDDDRVLAVFPFYHDISDEEYKVVVENYYELDMALPPKSSFCLMFESEFGWGWIHSKMVPILDIAEIDDYKELKSDLIVTKILKNDFVLNEDNE